MENFKEMIGRDIKVSEEEEEEEKEEERRRRGGWCKMKG